MFGARALSARASRERATGLVVVWIAIGCALLGGCGASAPRAAVASAVDRGEVDEAIDAYERLRANDGPDAELLARVAALVLMREARGDDRDSRRAAVQELGFAGTAGEPFLRELARGDGAARILALETLARRGDEGAKLHLRALADSDDADERAASVLGMDAEQDRALLLEAITWPAPAARQNAAVALASLAPDGEARDALEGVSRGDPEPGVRAAAVRSLGAYGPPALTALRERLSDPVGSVRMAAVEALMRADRDQARVILGSLFEMPASTQGIEAARLLAMPGRDARTGDDRGEGDEGARAYLRQALSAREPSLRAQAGVALVSLPGAEEMIGALREALARESDAGAKLSIARALLRQRGAEGDAREALRALMGESGTMNALQAAAVLADDGASDAGAAAETLAELLTRPDPVLRRTAARALARDARRPDDARAALRDHDASVRISAAGGILAAPR
jgi:hypothetical protein